MAASDNLSGPQFFHGSKYPFKPGELITPPAEGEATHNSSTDGWTFFHPDPRVADQFANRADQHVTASRAAANGLPALPRNKQYLSKVYQVEPTGPYEPDEDYAGEEGSLRSQHPLRVIGRYDRWGGGLDTGGYTSGPTFRQERGD